MSISHLFSNNLIDVFTDDLTVDGTFTVKNLNIPLTSFDVRVVDADNNVAPINSASCAYIKIGKMVFMNFAISTSGIGACNPSSTVYISLPFQASDAFGNGVSTVISTPSSFATAPPSSNIGLFSVVASLQAKAALIWQIVDASLEDVNFNDLDTDGSFFRGSLMYETV